MRIAYVSMDPGVPVFGSKGCSVHVQEVLRALCRNGADVRLFASRFGGGPPADLVDLPAELISRIGKGPDGERERAAMAADGVLLNALRDHGPFDAVYERYSLWSRAGVMYGLEEGIPAVLEVNAPLIEEQERHRTLVNREAACEAASFVFSKATTVLAVSPEVADYVVSRGGAAERVLVVANGVDTRRFRPGVAPAAPSGVFTVGFVGSLKSWHGVDRLLDAVAQLERHGRSVRVVIVGSGPEQSALEERARSLALSDVHFAGAVAPDRVPSWLASMDVAVAPYPELPGFYFSPMKLFEYMASGVPVVASDIGQIADVLGEGRFGVLVRPGDVDELAGALLELQDDPDRRAALARAARQRVATAHTWDRVAERILDACRRSRLQSAMEG